MALDLRSSELEHAFIKDRINNVEKHFSEISSRLAAYIKKTAHVRDSGEDLAKCILSYASKENLNLSLRTSLTKFADILLVLQEHREAQIQRIDVKVVMDFANYNTVCKKAKVDLKSSFEIYSKEISKKNQLEKTRSKHPSNWQKIAQAEKAVSQAKEEASRTTHELSRKMNHFEKQKIEDIQSAFMEFIKIEMRFHAMAIELYTKSYNIMKNIKVEDDLKEFRTHFRSYSVPQEYENSVDDDGPNKSSIPPSAQALKTDMKSEVLSKNQDELVLDTVNANNMFNSSSTIPKSYIEFSTRKKAQSSTKSSLSS